jgi:hypothetical protein
MEIKCMSRVRFVQWSKVWIALLLLWAYAVSAAISVKADSEPVKGISISGGADHTLALKSDGTVVAWVHVTAEDGATTNAYTVVVTRAQSTSDSGNNSPVITEPVTSIIPTDGKLIVPPGASGMTRLGDEVDVSIPGDHYPHV